MQGVYFHASNDSRIVAKNNKIVLFSHFGDIYLKEERRDENCIMFGKILKIGNQIKYMIKEDCFITMTNNNKQKNDQKNNDIDDEKQVNNGNIRNKINVVLNGWYKAATINNDTTCIILVGSSGNGKSSLIKLLTRDSKVKTAVPTDTKSHTSLNVLCGVKPLSMFYQNQSNVVFLDTIGMEDTKEQDTDENLFQQIAESINNFGICKVKFIWVVKECAKQNPTIKKQAKFISQFGINPFNNNNNNNNKNNALASIWDSVLVLVKEPRAKRPLKRVIQGVISMCHSNFGMPKNHLKVGENLFGYTNIDWMKEYINIISNKIQKRDNSNNAVNSENVDNTDKVGEAANSDTDDGDNDALIEQYDTLSSEYDCLLEDFEDDNNKRCYIYKSNEIENIIFKILTINIKSIKIIFRDFKCKYCDAKCDPRFVPSNLPCHRLESSENDHYHTSTHRNKQPIMKHIYEIENKNNENLTYKHCGKFIKVHPKCSQTKKHEKNNLIKAHIENSVLTSKGKIIVGCGIAISGTIAVATGGVGLIVEEAAIAVGSAVGGAIVSYLGLGATIAAAREKLGINGLCIYRCCNGTKDEPCSLVYECCKQVEGSDGCIDIPENERKYQCCQQSIDAIGCHQYWECCEKKGVNAQGCQAICQGCNKKAISNEETKGNEANEGNEGNEGNVENPGGEGIEGCGYEFECCHESGLVANIDKTKGCIKKCWDCGQIIGESKGCYVDSKNSSHEWIQI